MAVPIVFLDIDGVLLPHSPRHYNTCGICNCPASSTTFVSRDREEDPSSSLRQVCPQCASFHKILTPPTNRDFPSRTLSALSHILASVAPTPRIVLSTTWRVDPRGIADIKAQFQTRGPPNLKPHAAQSWDMTDPTIFSVRQWEISGFLQASGALHTTPWVALDDDDSIANDPKFSDAFKGHTVVTDPQIGLTMTDARKAVALLAAQTTGEGGGEAAK